MAGDAPAIAALARAELGDYGEAAALYAERLELAPDGCWVLVTDPPPTSSRRKPGSPDSGGATVAIMGDGQVWLNPILGHCISHPWPRFAPPAMHAMLGAIPPDADCWYLHDVVVAPAGRGTHAVERLLPVLADAAQAAGIDTLALIAVGGADAYWARQGFAAVDGGTTGFGADAVYMERTVSR